MASHINEKCTNCTVCLPICPTGSIYVGASRYVIDFDTCLDCQLCVPACPCEAIIPAAKPAPKK